MLTVIWELVYPHKEDAVHPERIAEYDLINNVQEYDNYHNRWTQMLPINIGFPVEVENGYIFGFVCHQCLCPFVVLEVGSGCSWVKIRIDGMVNEPILPMDPLWRQFFSRLPRPTENIHFAIRH
ncbi:uncharacterized protein LOC117174508 [Belonocnema kinseyi]|uniref:uncharacterized protein LOC117174508 n=1 Tax=Belonocnema kinseyi TaxID=2817044 RepID=UPI00143DB1D0|nr:uncharacterized protein LOC117174508 [Belonocnema kinseyi]